jgi:ribonuclease P protein component
MSASEPASFRFRPHEHLRRPTEFRKVYERRQSMGDSYLVVYACENGLPYSRLGLSVGRKLGNAVCRNRLRRLCREAFRLTRHELPRGLDLILIPKEGAEPALRQLQESLNRLVQSLARRMNHQTDRADEETYQPEA